MPFVFIVFIVFLLFTQSREAAKFLLLIDADAICFYCLYCLPFIHAKPLSFLKLIARKGLASRADAKN